MIALVSINEILLLFLNAVSHATLQLLWNRQFLWQKWTDHRARAL